MLRYRLFSWPPRKAEDHTSERDTENIEMSDEFSPDCVNYGLRPVGSSKFFRRRFEVEIYGFRCIARVTGNFMRGFSLGGRSKTTRLALRQIQALVCKGNDRGRCVGMKRLCKELKDLQFLLVKR